MAETCGSSAGREGQAGSAVTPLAILKNLTPVGLAFWLRVAFLEPVELLGPE